MNLSKFVIYLAAAIFLIYGFAFSIAPNSMSVLITGSDVRGVSAAVDFRATYGGMTIAVGFIILYLYFIKQVRPSLVVVVFVLFSMAITRTLGFLIEGTTNFLMYLYLALEIGGGLLAIFAMQREHHAAD